jgi:signal peptidase I
MENKPQTQTENTGGNSNAKEKKFSRADIIWTVVLSVIIVALITTILLKTFVFFNVKVDGPSMEPTLYGGEINQGKNDGTGDLLVGNRLKAPIRGDIIVIQNVVGNSWIIKRVIGLEGDEITIKDGKVFRKQLGQEEIELKETYVKGETFYKFSPSEVKFTVGKGEVFYLGDNRTNSSDSRIYGCCKVTDVVGVIEPYSLNQNSLRVFFTNFVNGIFSGSCS